MTDRAVLWIWLQDCIGFANTNVRAIFDFFEKPEDIITSDEKFLRDTGLFTVHAVDKIIRQDLRYAKKVYTDCMNMNYKLLTLFDAKYPERLRELPDCPVLLYVEGEMPETDTGLYTAIVGSRKATEESVKYAFDIAAGLALNDIVVVSGGAGGVDTAAHKGCMSCGGKTICVMGCGLDHSYLMKNKPMRDEIAKGYGETAVKSEAVFPGTEDVKGYWVSVGPEEGGSGAYVTAIARDYMDGALIFELDGHNGGDEAMDNQVAGVFSDMINSLEFAN